MRRFEGINLPMRNRQERLYLNASYQQFRYAMLAFFDIACTQFPIIIYLFAFWNQFAVMSTLDPLIKYGLMLVVADSLGLLASIGALPFRFVAPKKHSKQRERNPDYRHVQRLLGLNKPVSGYHRTILTLHSVLWIVWGSMQNAEPFLVESLLSTIVFIGLLGFGGICQGYGRFIQEHVIQKIPESRRTFAISLYGVADGTFMVLFACLILLPMRYVASMDDVPASLGHYSPSRQLGSMFLGVVLSVLLTALGVFLRWIPRKLTKASPADASDVNSVNRI